MQIRSLTLQEKQRFGEIERDAFLIEPAKVEGWLDRSFTPDDTHAIFNDAGEILSVLRVLYPQMWMGDNSVTMPGITNVATPIEHRRHGYLNRLLMHIMEQLREKGHSISTLYPFDFPFYKKFGYEHVANNKHIEVKMAALAKFKKGMNGRWRQKSLDDWAEFNALYQKFCHGKFGMISRTENRWRTAIMSRWGGQPKTAYIWHDDSGQARAYVIYHLKESEPWQRKLLVENMVWLDEAAYFEVLAFLANHDSQAQEVLWTTSVDDEFLALLDDPRMAEEKISAGFMLRILDAPLALTQRPWSPELSGSFSLTLRDNRLAWNNGVTLQIEVEGGQASVKSQKLQAEKAGLACDIRQLSQFYMGYLSPMQAARLKLLEVRDAKDLKVAQALFSPPGQPAPFMPDFW